MTKADLAKEISRSTGVRTAEAVAIIEKFAEIVKDSLSHGENVYLRGFGTFYRKHRAQKTARNISNNTSVIVPAHDIPAFKPADCFKKDLLKD